ncbi:MAG: hypothetical protein SA378_04795 [Sedimentibacter sp.]|uniref:hypothetical protein n=1 Tax=Sedimentibacter sp. TaxID=1960295 RepID=UPI0029819F75|nr:hypothetical protein [Sedimentibacter sp.]MDW5299439.1 hypothetical protein [Sedimentibacter sp.]
MDIIDVIVDHPEQVWELTSEFAGISKQFYDKYYQNKEVAVAYRLGDVRKYKNWLVLHSKVSSCPHWKNIFIFDYYMI